MPCLTNARLGYDVPSRSSFEDQEMPEGYTCNYTGMPYCEYLFSEFISQQGIDYCEFVCPVLGSPAQHQDLSESSE